MYAVHKYDQIISYVEDGINSGEIKLYSKLPSIKALQIKFNLSRSSVFQALESLKSRGIIESEPAVGYFVVNTQIRVRKKVLLIFSVMNLFKKELYETILKNLDKDVIVDMDFHYGKWTRLVRIIEQSKLNYNYIVVMPGPMSGLSEILDHCRGTVLLLDHFNEDIALKYSSVGQNFKMDTYNALVELQPRIQKYKSIVLFQADPIEPIDRFYGVEQFASEFGYQAQLQSDMDSLVIKPGTLYLIPNDNELVLFVRKMHNSELELTKDYGLISFNECALKEVLERGVTTITTDFQQMGVTLAGMINESCQENRLRREPNPWHVIIRDSI